MKKSFIALMLSLILSLGMVVNAFATDNNVNYYTGAIPEDGTCVYAPVDDEYSLTEEQLCFLSEKQAFFESLSENSLEASSKGTRSVTWKYLSGGFTVYPQLNNHYCGPATVYNTLYKLNGSSPSQYIIALMCGTNSNGTYLSKMVKYLNKKISTRSYDQKNGVNKTDMINYLYSGLCYEMPPIIGFACSTSNGWAYNSNGHFVNINGCKTDGSMFNLADPLIGYLGLTGAFYDKTSTQLYNAYNSVNIGLAW